MLNIKQWIANLTKSPKTSIGGIAAGLFILIPQIANHFEVPMPQLNPDGTAIVDENGQPVMSEPQPVSWPMVGLGLTLIWGGWMQRDADKSSEQVIKG